MAGTVSEVVTEIKICTGGLLVGNELLSEIAKREMGFSSCNNSNKTSTVSLRLTVNRNAEDATAVAFYRVAN